MNVKETLNSLHRSKTDRILGGVCGGFAETTDTPAWIWRAGFLFVALVLGTGLVAYLILWVLMPDGRNTNAGR